MLQPRTDPEPSRLRTYYFVCCWGSRKYRPTHTDHRAVVRRYSKVERDINSLDRTLPRLMGIAPTVAAWRVLELVDFRREFACAPRVRVCAVLGGLVRVPVSRRGALSDSRMLSCDALSLSLCVCVLASQAPRCGRTHSFVS